LNYKANNVFDEAFERIEYLFNRHDDIIVSMSGGKDSTVLFNIALAVATKLNRLPLKVFWLDQEAEWQSTVDYMSKIMALPQVKPCWFQIPFDFTNSLSFDNNFLRVWDETKENEWIHPKSQIAIKDNPTSYNRFHQLVQHLPECCTESNNCAVLVGMRVDESLNRRMTIMFGRESRDKDGILWCQKKHSNTQVFYPIYDFSFDDIWTAIAKNKWEYNEVYNYQYQKGLSKLEMRVSALIHETAWHSITDLQEFERETYNKFINRIDGVNCFNQFGKEIGVNDLPVFFNDWREYRDYLLVNLVQETYWELFRNRWSKQNNDEWYKVHIKEILVNDIDGTINGNASARMRKDNNKTKYKARDQLYLEKYKESKNDKRPANIKNSVGAD
jgi:predicted phosphoadenosine phosphosulfate sulfurtransferase